MERSINSRHNYIITHVKVIIYKTEFSIKKIVSKLFFNYQHFNYFVKHLHRKFTLLWLFSQLLRIRQCYHTLCSHPPSLTWDHFILLTCASSTGLKAEQHKIQLCIPLVKQQLYTFVIFLCLLVLSIIYFYQIDVRFWIKI